jgi:pyruvate formate lyase activating enzyme
MVTAGYIDKQAREEIYQYIDAVNIDLKAFTERFYHKLTFSHLEDVLDTILWLHNKTDIWFEITTLLIPDENDSPEEISRLCHWIIENLGDRVPLHFTAFHPDFKMRDKTPTPESSLSMARKIALDTGLKYCYLGNIFDHRAQTTYCPNCQSALIVRDWHSILQNHLKNSHCPECGEKIDGVFKE